MLPAISIKMLLELRCGLQHWRSCSSHFKNIYIYIPRFKDFLPLNIGRIKWYLPEVNALEIHLLFMEVCLFLSFPIIENFRHVCVPFFSRPVQTSHHPLKRQQGGVNHRLQSYLLFSFSYLLSQDLTRTLHLKPDLPNFPFWPTPLWPFLL